MIESNSRASKRCKVPGKCKLANHHYSTVPRLARYLTVVMKKNPNILSFKSAISIKHRISEANLSLASNGKEYRFPPVSLT